MYFFSCLLKLSSSSFFSQTGSGVYLFQTWHSYRLVKKSVLILSPDIPLELGTKFFLKNGSFCSIQNLAHREQFNEVRALAGEHSSETWSKKWTISSWKKNFKLIVCCLLKRVIHFQFDSLNAALFSQFPSQYEFNLLLIERNRAVQVGLMLLQCVMDNDSRLYNGASWQKAYNKSREEGQFADREKCKTVKHKRLSNIQIDDCINFIYNIFSVR